jgi:deoxycytidylate deaminase
MPARRGIKTWEQFTEQEQRFVNAYMSNGHNAVQAYKTAGYWCGPSYGAIRVAAFKIRHKSHIEREVADRMDALMMSEQEALIQQSELASFDVGELMIQDAVPCPHCGEEVVHSGEWRVDIQKAKDMNVTNRIKKWSYDKQGRLVVEFRDVDAAQKTILQAHGTFRSKKQEAVADGMAALLAAARMNVQKALTAKPEMDADFEVEDQPQLAAHE